MADSLGNGEFWLPSEFLTDDDILMDKENFNKNGLNTAIGSNYCFPTEFPYDSSSFESSSVLSSPVESVFGSIETESDGEDLLAGLTRLLARSTFVETRQTSSNLPKTEKLWVQSGSPQSTLVAAGNWSVRSPVSSNGSPNGPSQVSSPTATPVGPNNDAWDLIYAAAGQVARLKMNGSEGPPKSRGLIDPHRGISPAHQLPPVKTPNSGFYSNQCLSSNNFPQASQFQYVKENQVLNQQCSSIWGKPAKEGLFYQQNQFQFGANHPNMSNRARLCGCGCESNQKFGQQLGLSRTSWPSLQFQQNQNHQNQSQTQTGSGMRAVFLSGSNVKKECAGTGVFLPRRYGNPSDSRKKPGCSTALLPARVVQALNKNFDEMTPHAHPQSHFNGPPTPDYDAFVARRNALLTQQKRMNNEIRLPQEWTY